MIKISHRGYRVTVEKGIRKHSGELATNQGRTRERDSGRIFREGKDPHHRIHKYIILCHKLFKEISPFVLLFEKISLGIKNPRINNSFYKKRTILFMHIYFRDFKNRNRGTRTRENTCIS